MTVQSTLGELADHRLVSTFRISKPPGIPLANYIYSETRNRTLTQSHPDEARRLLALTQQDVNDRWNTTSSSPGRMDFSNGA